MEACLSPSEMYRAIICTSVYYFGVKAQRRGQGTGNGGGEGK